MGQPTSRGWWLIEPTVLDIRVVEYGQRFDEFSVAAEMRRCDERAEAFYAERLREIGASDGL